MKSGAKIGDLFKEIADGTIIWRQPTERERFEGLARRQRIFEDSRVPWIVSDIGGLTQFFEDAQDVLAFTKWNKRLFDPRRIAKCMKRAAVSGRPGLAALSKCLCQAPKRQRKRALSKSVPKFTPDAGFLIPLALRLFPGTAPIMWALLAGQLAYMLTGYGLKLGAVVGGALELLFRGFEEIGAPFGPEHNKFQQLKRARLLQEAERGVAASRFLNWEDRFLSIVALKLALGDLLTPKETIVDPADYPSFAELFTDPFGTFESLVGLADTILPNAYAYTINDMLLPALQDLSRLVHGEQVEIPQAPNRDGKSLLKMFERGECPSEIVCPELLEDEIALEGWLAAKSLVQSKIGHITLLKEGWLGRRIVPPSEIESF